MSHCCVGMGLSRNWLSGNEPLFKHLCAAGYARTHLRLKKLSLKAPQLAVLPWLLIYVRDVADTPAHHAIRLQAHHAVRDAMAYAREIVTAQNRENKSWARLRAGAGVPSAVPC